MSRTQVEVTDSRVLVTFDRKPIEMPPVLAYLIRQHLGHRGNTSYASHGNG